MSEVKIHPPQHPYASKPESAFWRSAVADLTPEEIGPLYEPKFDIDGMRVATAGSCFAQHITKALRRAGFPFVDVEPAPSGLAAEHLAKFGFGMYSARYGNVYTSRQMLQLLRRAAGTFVPETSAWTHEDGYVDPFRPTIEPVPFESVAELERSREDHLQRVGTLFETADLLVFTLGLTEAWSATADGAVFPLAPGVAGGRYDPTQHRFVNLTFADVVGDMEQLFAGAREINPEMHFLLTVSPVPLAATATDEHVVVATSHSKAILRAACGELTGRHDYVDYFPSYEIIAAPVARGAFYGPGGRNVTAEGVDHVMRQFLTAHGIEPGEHEPDATPSGDPECDEELLAAAARLH